MIGISENFDRQLFAAVNCGDSIAVMLVCFSVVMIGDIAAVDDHIYLMLLKKFVCFSDQKSRRWFFFDVGIGNNGNFHDGFGGSDSDTSAKHRCRYG